MTLHNPHLLVLRSFLTAVPAPVRGQDGLDDEPPQRGLLVVLDLQSHQQLRYYIRKYVLNFLFSNAPFREERKMFTSLAALESSLLMISKQTLTLWLVV